MASLVYRLLGSLHSAPVADKAPGHVAASVGLGRGLFSPLSEFLGAANALLGAYGGNSVKLLVLGSIIETGRRLFQWFMARFSIEYCTTMRLTSGDPAYEWVVLLLTQENVWRRARDFVVTANNSRRKWAVRTELKEDGTKVNAEYVPTYARPQLFRWRGYWVEIQRTGNITAVDTQQSPQGAGGASMTVTIYTLDMKVLSDFMEDAHDRYVQVNRPHVVVHMIEQNFGPNHLWSTAKHKMKRPLSSIILPHGVVDSLVDDAKEFISSEGWYAEAGIPHRRGYLLYGPPGTGKTSTIYALAGALNLEIYVLSLSPRFVDDAYLQRAASAIPKHGIFVIEDIDCAFPRRDEDDPDDMDDASYAAFMHNTNPTRMVGGMRTMMAQPVRTAVTLSGLLNVIDGVGSEEGKLFFATTNHIERLDPALLRPGRIDMKVQYEMATKEQAGKLFERFFPETRFPELAEGAAPIAPQSRPAPSPAPSYFRNAAAVDLPDPELDSPTSALTVSVLANLFAARIPEGEFTTAELQGYLQGYKTAPIAAVRGASTFVEKGREERKDRDRIKTERRARVRERRALLAANTPGAGGTGGLMPGAPGANMRSTRMERGLGMLAASAQASGAATPAVPTQVPEVLPALNGNGPAPAENLTSPSKVNGVVSSASAESSSPVPVTVSLPEAETR